jgi:hypothetical protein
VVHCIREQLSTNFVRAADLCAHVCCHPCGTAQEMRHVRDVEGPLFKPRSAPPASGDMVSNLAAAYLS